MKLITIGAALILALYPRNSSDPESGSIGGRVTDEKLIPIASAALSARNIFSGDVNYVRSDTTGTYRFAELRPGRYSVFAKAEGYGCTWILRVPVFRGKHTELDVVITKSPKGAASDGCESST
jgi:hypothetical protein